VEKSSGYDGGAAAGVEMRNLISLERFCHARFAAGDSKLIPFFSSAAESNIFTPHKHRIDIRLFLGSTFFVKKTLSPFI